MLIQKKSWQYGLIVGMVVAALGTTKFLVDRHQQSTAVGQLAALLCQHALTYDIDARSVDPTVVVTDTLSVTGFEAVTARITAAVRAAKPLHFTLVGFPYKSQNTAKKVITTNFDAADAHGLSYLNTMLSKMSAAYKPGAALTLFMDGTVFCDLEGVSDATVTAYEAALKQYAKKLVHLHIVTLADLLPRKTPAAMRTIIGGLPPSLATFEQRLAVEPDLQNEVAIMEQRMLFEFDYPGGEQRAAQVHTIAKNLVHRSMQYSAFLKAFRHAESIRLSVHYQPDVAVKMGIKLAEESCVTPWHGVLVHNTMGNPCIKHRMDLK